MQVAPHVESSDDDDETGDEDNENDDTSDLSKSKKSKKKSSLVTTKMVREWTKELKVNFLLFFGIRLGQDNFVNG